MDEIKIQKTTAVLLAILAVAVVLGAYMAMGSKAEAKPSQQGNGSSSGDIQDIYSKALNTGSYDKQEVTVSRGTPVRLHFTADTDAGCGRQLVIYGLGVTALSRNGEEHVVDFTPAETGTYEYNCGMRMWQPGKLVVQ